MSSHVPENAIVVGVDGSAESWHALRWAADRAGRTHRPLHVIHAQGALFSSYSPAPEGEPIDGICEEALDIVTKKRIVTMTAPGVPEKRLTFTLPILLDSNFVVLHIEGEDKKKTLAEAEKPGPITDMTVRAFLRAREPIILYWCP